MRQMHIELEFTGPFLTQFSGGRSLTLDSSMARYRGRPVISGSLIKGCIRHAMTRFSAISDQLTADDVIDWFGSESQVTESLDTSFRSPGRLYFDYVWKQSADQKTEVNQRNFRITLNEHGVAKPGHLATIEALYKSGASAHFSGSVRLDGSLSDEDVKRITGLIRKSLHYTPAMGAMKGVGYGRVKSFAVQESELTHDSKAMNGLDSCDRLGLSLQFDRPIHLSGLSSQVGNSRVSQQYCHGSVLKGALARQLAQVSDDLQSDFLFDDLVFTHALPATSKQNVRSLPLPLSLASAKLDDSRTVIADTALEPNARFVTQNKRKLVFLTSEAFQKLQSVEGTGFLHYVSQGKAAIKELAATLFSAKEGVTNDVTCSSHTQVRTAINHETGAASESQLFSQHNIETQDKVWLADVDFSQVPESRRGDVVKAVSSALSKGLHPIGKTKAMAATTVSPNPYRDQPTIRLEKGKYIRLLLLSDARILPEQLETTSSNSYRQLEQKYSEYFAAIGDGLFRLSHYFAEQRFAGGLYYFKRFRQKQVDDYRPEILTRRGSVFVLEAEEVAIADKVLTENALALLTSWSRLGLPSAPDRLHDSWQTDPFVRENGFGEVMINYPLLKPTLEK